MRAVKTYFIALIAALVLIACAPQTVRNNLETVSQMGAQYTHRTAVLLQNDLITVEEAKSRLAALREARRLVGVANQAQKTCAANGDEKCTEAALALASATSLMAELDLWLIEREKAKRGN